MNTPLALTLACSGSPLWPPFSLVKLCDCEGFSFVAPTFVFFAHLHVTFWFRRLHAGGLVSHFGHWKTFVLVSETFDWPSLLVLSLSVAPVRWWKPPKRTTCLYSPLPNPHGLGTNLSMFFGFRLLCRYHGHKSIFVIVDHFSKVAHFVPCSKTYNGSYIVWLFFGEVVSYMASPLPLCLNVILNVLATFGKLWHLMGTQLKFLWAFYPKIDGQIEVINHSFGNLLCFLVGGTYGELGIITSHCLNCIQGFN